jgi:cysteine desulfurase/selenocysteine lyase
MLKNDIIYFDNAATAFKPKSVIEDSIKYYEQYSVNAHRSDYNLSVKVDQLYEDTRKDIQKFINANLYEEIIFTSGTTESLNMIINGYLKNNLKKGDEVLTTKSEHASVLLPLFELVSEIGIVIKYIPLDEDYKLNINNVKKCITNKTKAIVIAHVTNTIGDIRPIKEICNISDNIITIIDGAQSIAHLKVDVKNLNADFYAFSAHKMYGPTGIGILYGKYDLLNNLKPINLGGGMNSDFNSDTTYELKELPFKLEAGTQNIVGILGFNAAVKYINNIGFSNIEKYEQELKKYLIEQLEQLQDIIIYNKNADSEIIIFNSKNIFSQDLAIYLDKHNICVRAGNHCARLLKEVIGINNTCRISIAFYNTKEEIDKLISALNNKNILKDVLNE